MKARHLWTTFFVVVVLDGALRRADATCVLESDFGFNLKCRFKKSGLFRVRNLGGVKGYFGLGFTVGDELGLPESLSNTESNKRRSAAAARSSMYNPLLKKSDATRLVSLTTGYRVPPSGAALPAFKPLPPDPAAASRYQHLLTAPGYPAAPAAANLSRPSRLAGPHTPLIAAVAAPALGVPAFQALPASITRVQDAASTPPPRGQLVALQVVRAPVAFRQSLQAASSHFQVRKDPGEVPTAALTTRRLPSDQQQSPTTTGEAAPAAAAPGKAPVVSSAAMRQTIKLLAQASNVSEDAIAQAIVARQQQLLMQQRQAMALASTTTTTTTSTTTRRPPPDVNVIGKYPLAAGSKVMNAPKEYYPVGYDKDFDDNFASRVELPETSFYCGDQKHFPGLYADEDLGCMVFHVCAFTDDGLIMKSFLCPESTLFDQTILKCNWWFYVDCKASKKLYDSNIPVSKSYQLMKALAFFSSYSKS